MRQELPRLRTLTRRGKAGQEWLSYSWDGRSRGLGEISLGTDRERAIGLYVQYEQGGEPRTDIKRRENRSGPAWKALPPKARDMYRNAYVRATSRQRECMSTDEFAVIWNRAGGRCEVSGVPLVITASGGPYEASIDRIDSKRGYEADNCRIVCTLVNYAMNMWGEAPLRVVAASLCGTRRGTSAEPLVSENGECPGTDSNRHSFLNGILSPLGMCFKSTT